MALAKGRVRGKVINAEKPGKDVTINVNGQRYNYEDGSIVDMPWSVSQALAIAIKTRWVQKGNEMIQKKEARYLFIEMPETEAEKNMSKEEKKDKELITEILDDKPKKAGKKK